MRERTFVALLLVAGCSIEAPQAEVGVYLKPDDAGGDGGVLIGVKDGASDGSSPRPPSVTFAMSIRDFKHYDARDPATNPAFGNGPSEGVVAGVLGDDGKPVYMTPTNTTPTFGKKFFDQWYRDVPGTNVPVAYPLIVTLTADGQYEYDSEKSGVLEPAPTGGVRRIFAPIDDGTPYETVYGNQGAPHNFNFTGEIHTVFTHLVEGGSLRFRSDDDLYVFIDKKLVIDLGGTHIPAVSERSTEELGLTLGQDYVLDIFYAERGGANANLLITTSFELRPIIN